jgi:Uma2 family endonuclease
MIEETALAEDIRTTEADYETERNKPMPNRIHGRIQQNIGFQLKLNYEDQFSIESEVTLNTQPKSSTPDICIYPKTRLRLKDIQAKTADMPLTTIEIQSPSQSPEILIAKAWDSYFPAGVRSAWVVIPAMKAVRIILPDEQSFLFISGEIHDPATDIRISVEKVFEDMDW